MQDVCITSITCYYGSPYGNMNIKAFVLVHLVFKVDEKFILLAVDTKILHIGFILCERGLVTSSLREQAAGTGALSRRRFTGTCSCWPLHRHFSCRLLENSTLGVPASFDLVFACWDLRNGLKGAQLTHQVLRCRDLLLLWQDVAQAFVALL